MYYYISIITGAVTTPTVNLRKRLTYFLSFQTEIGKSLKLTDLIDTLQLLTRTKDVCRIFEYF